MLNLLPKDVILQRSLLIYASFRTIVQKSVYTLGKKRIFSLRLQTTSGCLEQSSGQASINMNKYSTGKEDNVTGLSYKPTATTSDNPSLSTSVSQPEEIEVSVGPVDDLQLGLIKEVAVGDQKVLLVKEKNGIFAFGSKCTHYGLPLANGAYCNGRIRCPFHGACFNVKTGDIEDFPGLDSLHTFNVKVEDNMVKVTVAQAKLKEFRRVKPMVKYSKSTKQVNLLVGGGPASLICAETLRQEGFTGKIILASKEDCIPYDRVKLSKAMSTSPASIALRSKEFLDEHDIEFLGEKQLVNIDSAKKVAIFKDGTEINYTNLLLATGGNPRKLEIPGNDLKNICFLRTPNDSNYIAKESQQKNVVVIGSSFIGMEVAATLLEKAKSVTVICRTNLPFKTVLGSPLAEKILQLHKDKGVKFQFNTTPTEFKGNAGTLTSVVLANGEELPADLCVVGIGVVPSTTYLQGTPLEKDSFGFITVNEYMQTNVEGIYAAGDITEFPLFIRSNNISNVQHWQMAHAQGKNAALNMLGKNIKIRSVPYFWTMMFGKSIRYAGYGVDYNDIVVQENGEKIACFYTKGEEILAVASLNHDPIVSKMAEIMAEGKIITKTEIVNKSNKWLFN